VSLGALNSKPFKDLTFLTSNKLDLFGGMIKKKEDPGNYFSASSFKLKLE
jgi:hypothetical protein